MNASRALPLLLLLAACGGDEPAPAGDDPVQAMRAEIEAMAQMPEKAVSEVEVLHILVGYDKAPRLPHVTRTLAEAERLAAELLVRARGGEDFETLMQQFSDDTGGGHYILTAKAEDAEDPGDGDVLRFFRGRMMPNFGAVAFKLDVGQIGVAPQHPLRSVYGWHIIKRVR